MAGVAAVAQEIHAQVSGDVQDLVVVLAAHRAAPLRGFFVPVQALEEHRFSIEAQPRASHLHGAHPVPDGQVVGGAAVLLGAACPRAVGLKACCQPVQPRVGR